MRASGQASRCWRTCASSRTRRTHASCAAGVVQPHGDIARQDAATLSGGEKTKLALAQLVAGKTTAPARPSDQQPDLRPHGCRTGARAWPGTMVIVSHDPEFVAALSRSGCCSCPKGESTTGKRTSSTCVAGLESLPRTVSEITDRALTRPELMKRDESLRRCKYHHHGKTRLNHELRCASSQKTTIRPNSRSGTRLRSPFQPRSEPRSICE